MQNYKLLLNCQKKTLNSWKNSPFYWHRKHLQQRAENWPIKNDGLLITSAQKNGF